MQPLANKRRVKRQRDIPKIGQTNMNRRQKNSRCPKRRRAEGGQVFAVALLSAALAVFPCALAGETRHTKATAYYYPTSFYERNGLAKPENIDFTKISRVNYASFQLDGSGSIWGTDVNADAQILHGPINWNPPAGDKKYCHFTSPSNIPSCQNHHIEKGLIRSAHSVGTRVYATIGGPDFSEHFSSMAADPKARATFAERCAKIVSTYNFDGIDIDWRFPNSASDMANYSLLLSQIRNELDSIGSYGLTASLSCVQDDIPNVDIIFLDHILDELNLQTVNFHGPWDKKVGASAALYDRVGEQGFSIDSCVNTYLNAGATKEKINVAIPFYGLSFSGAFAIGQEAKCNWIGDCSDTVTWQQDSGSPKYHNIYKKLPELDTTFDNETMATFAFGGAGIVSFDDERSVCLKTEYVIEHELGGVLIMELGSDLLEEFSTPLLDAMNLKLLNQELQCDGNAFMESLLRHETQHETIVNEGRDAPIVENTFEEKELSVMDFLYTEEVKQEYRYTCGFGEGDARKKCSRMGWQEGWEETTCNTGICPSGQLCFLSLCDVIPKQSFVKPVPKSKPKRKPATIMISTLERTDQEAFSPNDGALPFEDTNMAFSCGNNFHDAEACGQPCPNGLSDCPSGQFCFWLECKSNTAQLLDKPESSTPQVTVQQYKCGSTRDEALTCAEDCSSSWQCSNGKDCYLVPCPL